MKKFNFKSIITMLAVSLLMFSLSASAQEGSPLKGLFADDYAFVMKIAPAVVAISEVQSKAIDITDSKNDPLSAGLDHPLSLDGAIVDLSSGESPFERQLSIAKLTSHTLDRSPQAKLKPTNEANVEVGWPRS